MSSHKLLCWTAAFSAVFCLVFLFSCRNQEKDVTAAGDEALLFSKAKLKKDPILTIEDKTFFNSDFIAYLKENQGEAASRLSADSLSPLFDRFLEEKILLAGAVKKGISVNPEEMKNYLEKTGLVSNPDRTADSTVPGYVIDNLMVEKYLSDLIRNLTVEEQEIKEYYEQNKKNFLLPERVQVSQIMVSTEDRAVDLLRKLENAGETEFRRLAREESVGPEAIKGGLMGIFKPGDLPYDMEKMIFSLKEGMVSPVVESAYGFHLFRLDKTYPPQLKPMAEVAAAIRGIVLENKVKNLIEKHLVELKNSLNWQVHQENLFFKYQRTDK